jgi:hypothetical protein
LGSPRHASAITAFLGLNRLALPWGNTTALAGRSDLASVPVARATGSEAIANGYILLMLSIPIYLYLRWCHQRDRISMRTEPYELPRLSKEAPATLERMSR